MLSPTVSRNWNGIHIEGQQIALRIYPAAQGTLGMCVIAMPAMTGFARPCGLTDGNERMEFAPGEIAVHDNQLECFAADALAPFFSRGFKLVIEPGMADHLRNWLPKLIVVAETAKALADRFSAQLPPPLYHMLDAITSVVARIVLDGWEVAHSVSYERRCGIWSGEHAFMAQFDAHDVLQDLHALGAAAGGPAPAASLA